ncbi:MAG: RecQ family ATP-dependent DNA helicase [Coriobacteriia bacterium]|nr:RecQ family ATP-dependent DNA helicase [Coriobacteriia bacterium]
MSQPAAGERYANLKMQRFSASYIDSRNNFVIIGNALPHDESDEFYSFYCVLMNLLNRGHITRPSQFLVKALGGIESEVDEAKAKPEDLNNLAEAILSKGSKLPPRQGSQKNEYQVLWDLWQTSQNTPRNPKENEDISFKFLSLFKAYISNSLIINDGDISYQTSLRRHFENAVIDFTSAIHRQDYKEPEVVTQASLCLISPKLPSWIQTIKGAKDSNDYPAYDFYSSLIDKYLGGYSFVKQLLLPEATIEDIVCSNVSEFAHQQVDFYLPQLQLVIEIDGAQHEERLQKAKDVKRDEFLNRHGVEVVRISASSVKREDTALVRCMNDLRSKLESSQLTRDYMRTLKEPSYYTAQKVALDYEMVIRFQMLLCSLLQSGRIGICDDVWKFSLRSEAQNTGELFQLAVDDIFLWLENLVGISGRALSRPKIEISKKNSSKNILVDIDLFERWDDSLAEPGAIYIRNDYFDKGTNLQYDFFVVSAAESINYSMPETEQEQIKRMPHLEFVLKNVFGHDKFAPGQLPIIARALNKNEVIGILPTGAGKSLCYQYCCLLQPTVNYVVAPLVSLMQDQKLNMAEESGTDRTAFLNSTQRGDERARVLGAFGKGKYLIAWISPERFQSQQFRDALTKINQKLSFAYAVIDEAHCLSEWGHDFRVSYLNVTRSIQKHSPSATLIGLTATASEFVRKDLIAEFGVDEDAVEDTKTMRRDELTFHIHTTQNKKQALNEIISANLDAVRDLDEGRKARSAGLIFTVYQGGKTGCTRLSVEIQNWLKKEHKVKGGAAASYHGKLDGCEKERIQDDYTKNKYALLVATKAFGMGINKKNINYTVHYGMPWSVEAFYQEAGRAGRGRQDSNCYILYTPESPAENGRIAEIFHRNTSIARLKELAEVDSAPWKRKHIENDLGDILGLWAKGEESIEDDFQAMKRIAEMLKATNTRNGSLLESAKLWQNLNGEERYAQQKKFTQSKVESALYHLSVLGIVEDWTVEKYEVEAGAGKAIFMVYLREVYDEQDVKACLDRYVKRYGAEAERLEEYSMLLQSSQNRIDGYMKCLLHWTYDNITYSRRRSIASMREVCETHKTSDEIKSYIESYFVSSDATTGILSHIVAQPKNYELWLDALFQEGYANGSAPLDDDQCRRLLASLTRYLESYRYIDGLNFLDGMLRIRLDRFEGTDAIDRLIESLSRVSQLNENEQNAFFQAVLLFAGDMPEILQVKLSATLIEVFPHTSRLIYEKLGDDYSLAFCIRQRTESLNSLLTKINDGIELERV